MTQTLTFDYMDYRPVFRKDYILHSMIQKKENQEKEPQKLIFL